MIVVEEGKGISGMGMLRITCWLHLLKRNFGRTNARKKKKILVKQLVLSSFHLVNPTGTIHKNKKTSKQKKRKKINLISQKQNCF